MNEMRDGCEVDDVIISALLALGLVWCYLEDAAQPSAEERRSCESQYKDMRLFGLSFVNVTTLVLTPKIYGIPLTLRFVIPAR